MSFLQILLVYLFLLCLSLSYFPVGLNNSRGGKKLKAGTPMKTSLWFSLTALGMLMAGYYLAGMMEGRMEGYAHWASFLLIIFIGSRIIMQGIRKRSSTMVFDIEEFSVMFPLALIMSFNPLFAGVALRFMVLPFSVLAGLFALMVWLFSFTGLLYGNHFSVAFSHRMEILSGTAIIFLALVFQFAS
jgi:manganese efflux pump family protein